MDRRGAWRGQEELDRTERLAGTHGGPGAGVSPSKAPAVGVACPLLCCMMIPIPQPPRECSAPGHRPSTFGTSIVWCALSPQ